MKRKILVLNILLVCLFGFVENTLAEDKPIKSVGLEQHDFFDPTRKEKVEEKYSFGIAYHLEAGYAQDHQRMTSDTISALYLHGARVGAQFEMFLPMHFSVNVGVLYTVLYGISRQHYHSVDPDDVQVELSTTTLLSTRSLYPCAYNILYRCGSNSPCTSTPARNS